MKSQRKERTSSLKKGLDVGKVPREQSHEKFSRQSCREMAISDGKSLVAKTLGLDSFNPVK